jgi:hypothetical protein
MELQAESRGAGSHSEGGLRTVPLRLAGGGGRGRDGLPIGELGPDWGGARGTS